VIDTFQDFQITCEHAKPYTEFRTRPTQDYTKRIACWNISASSVSDT